jgi:hypothetical protein
MPQLAHARVHQGNAGSAPLPGREDFRFRFCPGKVLKALVQWLFRRRRKMEQQVMGEFPPSQFAHIGLAP